MGMKTLNCSPNPCNSCSYRKDTPSGIWAQEEYDKLPEWDDPMAFSGTFLCHNDPGSVCRGWLEVHQDNVSVRLQSLHINWNDANLKPSHVPLYASGKEARLAGMRGIKRPSKKAKEKARQILKRRFKKLVENI